jgi:hypothetical protein
MAQPGKKPAAKSQPTGIDLDEFHQKFDAGLK